MLTMNIMYKYLYVVDVHKYCSCYAILCVLNSIIGHKKSQIHNTMLFQSISFFINDSNY